MVLLAVHLQRRIRRKQLPREEVRERFERAGDMGGRGALAVGALDARLRGYRGESVSDSAPQIYGHSLYEKHRHNHHA